MELLKSFFKPQLHFSHQAMSPQSHCPGRLTALPLELLVLVCNSLSPVDLVCFCLCNHRLHIIFKIFYHCPTLRDDKLSIFTRLERDLPEYFACDICIILHRYNGSESFGLSGLALSALHQDRISLSSGIITHTLLYLYFGQFFIQFTIKNIRRNLRLFGNVHAPPSLPPPPPKSYLPETKHNAAGARCTL
jgi:hypothetical protein